MKNIGFYIFLVFVSLFIFSCNSFSITQEHIENDVLNVDIEEYETGRDDCFEKIIISIKNNSDKELEFSTQSFFEDIKGRYHMINLPSKLYPNATRLVAIRRTYYKGEDNISFNLTGGFWGITGFELDKGSRWEISDSDLNVHDVYLTLVFKIDDKIYSNTYHLNN